MATNQQKHIEHKMHARKLQSLQSVEFFLLLLLLLSSLFIVDLNYYILS